MKTATIGLAACLTVLASSQPGLALTIVQTAGADLVRSDFCTATTVSFDQVPLSAHETLSVTMALSGSMFASADIVPFTGFPVDADVLMSVGLTVDGPGLPPVQPCATPGFALVGNLDLAPGAVSESPVFGSLDLGTADVSPTLGNDGYIGSGLVDVSVFLSEDSDVCSSFEAAVMCGFFSNWALTLTYDITEGRIPEPSSMLLLLTGGLGLLPLRRRQQVRIPNPLGKSS